MAEYNINIHIIDDGAAKDWTRDVLATNEEFRKVMDGAAQALQAAKDCGEGTIVDELYELGTNVMNSASKVFNKLNEISSVVNTILGGLSNFVSNAVGAIGNAKDAYGG